MSYTKIGLGLHLGELSPAATYSLQPSAPAGTYAMARPSRKTARQDQILASLNVDPAMRVQELAVRLDVSTETVRRDLNDLELSGEIKRTYGGAVRAKRFEPLLTDRLVQQVPQRQSIARCAAERLKGIDTLLIGGGATTFHFARELVEVTYPLTVITPSYGVAVELSRNSLIEVLCLPGIFDGREGLVCGLETVSAIGRYRVPAAVIGASGIAADGISEAMHGPSQIYKAMIETAGNVFVLADGSKFNKRALVLLSAWAPKFTLVTDVAPTGDLLSSLEGGGVQVVIAESFT